MKLHVVSPRTILLDSTVEQILQPIAFVEDVGSQEMVESKRRRREIRKIASRVMPSSFDFAQLHRNLQRTVATVS